MQIYPRVRALRTALFCGQPGPRNEHTKTYDAKQALVNIEKSEQRIEHLIVLTMSEHEHEGEIKKEEGLPPLPEEDEEEDEEDVCIDYDEEEEDDDDDEDEDKDENDKQDDDDDNDDDDDDEEEDNDQQTHHGPPHAPGPPPPHAYYPYPYAYAGAYAMGPPPTDYTGTLDPSVYTDASSTTDPAPDTRRNRGGVTEPFPEKLHRMLDGVEREGLSDVVSFFSHGRAFAIHKPRRFVSEIMPRFFRQSRLTSFQRQLNLYGFRRISQGPDNGGYYHELFLKGRVGLCVNMKRIKVKGQLKLKRDPDSEPNFYAMRPVAVSISGAPPISPSTAPPQVAYYPPQYYPPPSYPPYTAAQNGSVPYPPTYPYYAPYAPWGYPPQPPQSPQASMQSPQTSIHSPQAGMQSPQAIMHSPLGTPNPREGAGSPVSEGSSQQEDLIAAESL